MFYWTKITLDPQGKPCVVYFKPKEVTDENPLTELHVCHTGKKKQVRDSEA